MEIEIYDFTGEGNIKGLTSGEMVFGIGCEAMWPNDPSSPTCGEKDGGAHKCSQTTRDSERKKDTASSVQRMVRRPF